jgi:hypothetical protein
MNKRRYIENFKKTKIAIKKTAITLLDCFIFSYRLYAAVNAFGFIFIYFLLPETKGKTFAEIEKIFAKKE